MQHVIKKGCLLTLMLASISSAALAGNVPQRIAFVDGEQFNQTLSRLNFNRVFVEGEIIIKTSYPEGTFTVDISERDNPNSTEGSVYLKPMFEAPITIYFTTDKEHHFSLAVSSDEGSGKTVRLSARNESHVEYVKRNAPNVPELDDVLTAMKAGETPQNFKSARVIRRPFYIKKDIKVSLLKRYLGEDLTGYVYRIENKASKSVAISTSLFDHHGAQTLALSEESLAPRQIAYLYGLYHNEG